MLLYLCDHKIEWPVKGGETYQCTCRNLQFFAHLQNITRDSRPRRTQMNKKQIEIWFFFSPKSKISCVKKSSLVLASISKKCKLKFGKNISKCRIFQLESPVKHWTTHTMLYPGQTGASEVTHIREAWVQLKVSYAQFIPGQHFGKSNIHLYTET